MGPLFLFSGLPRRSQQGAVLPIGKAAFHPIVPTFPARTLLQCLAATG